MIRARLCSQNEHKLRELRDALPGWVIEPLDRDDFPAETGETYEQNALLKARFGRTHAPADEWVLSDDAGVEAAALGGAPGVHSARWADDPVGSLLRELQGIEDRRVRYVCVLAAISPQGEEVTARGTLEGTVIGERRGTGGFGYDPVVVPDGERLTVAELGNGWKRERSARGQAARGLRELVSR